MNEPGDDGSTPADGGTGPTCNPCGLIGSVVMPPDASPDAEVGRPCGTGVCGIVVQPTDAGTDADAALACGTGVCGTVVMPTDAAADGASDQ